MNFSVGHYILCMYVAQKQLNMQLEAEYWTMDKELVLWSRQTMYKSEKAIWKCIPQQENISQW